MVARVHDIRPRFWSKVDTSGGPDACWPWLGYVMKRGYGQIGAPGRGSSMLYAHRLSYELAHGPIPDGLTIDHTCHNKDLGCVRGFSCPHRRCVNPAHLEAVSRGENHRRAFSARRTAA